MLYSICLTSQIEYRTHRDMRQLEEVLAAIAHGDKEALQHLYQSTRTAVYGFALSILKNRHDAEDILQEVYIRIFHSSDSYRPEGKPMAWIFAITRNLALMRLREGRRYGELPEEAWAQIPAKDSGLSTEDRMVLDAAMQGLTDEERQIVMLHALTGMKHREIAEVMELALPTVLSKYHRAIKKMRHMLTEGL